MKQLIKPILTIVVGIMLFMIGYSLGETSNDTLLITWIVCGIPYGLPRLRSWWSVSNADLGMTMVIFILNFILAGLIGGFIYVWTMCKAVFTIITVFINRDRNQQDTVN